MYKEPIFPYRKPDYFSLGNVLKAVATGGISLITDKAKATATAATNAAQTYVQAADEQLIAQQEALQQAQARLTAQQDIIRQYEQMAASSAPAVSALSVPAASTSAESKSSMMPVVIVAVAVIGLILIFKK